MNEAQRKLVASSLYFYIKLLKKKYKRIFIIHDNDNQCRLIRAFKTEENNG